MSRRHSFKLGDPVWVHYVDNMTIRPCRIKASIMSVDGDLIGVRFTKGQNDPWLVHSQALTRRTETEFYIVYKDKIDGPFKNKREALLKARSGMLKLSKVVNGKPSMI